METTVAPIIEANKLSKCYYLWNRPVDRLLAGSFQTLARTPLCPEIISRHLSRRAGRLGRAFYALENVSITVEPGESLGIIGRNGSGKSTLLQILAGTLTPTTGQFSVRGRVAALLELGSGFNPEFTGRENVLLQTALAGVSPKETMTHFEEVADFAAIGEFIDQPVKTYSSGMMVRLAFATQTILRPNIFIVDEALAVGDIFFQAKCARFFQQRLAEGMSLLFVSHDLTSVKTLCRQALVLDRGKAAFLGDSAAAVSHFHHLHSSATFQETGATHAASAAGQTHEVITLPPGAIRRNWEPTDEIGTREAEIVFCRVCDHKGAECRSFIVGESFAVEVYVQGNRPVNHLQFAIEISDRHNRVIYGVSSVHLGIGYQRVEENEILGFRVSFEPRLGAGDYLFDVALGYGNRGDGAPAHHVHRVARIATVSLRHAGLLPTFFGPASLGAKIEVMSASNATS